MSEHHQHPNRLANRYRVDSPIGEGAHATTWRGWDERLDRPVAIKMLHQRLASDAVFVERFRAEAKVAASVRQGNVVDVYDFGQEDGTLYIVMQYVDGEDLKAIIDRAAPLPVRDVRRIIGNVLDGLHAIHAAGIVHRDIKPQNVLIGSDGTARVTDFGIADVHQTAGLTAEGLTIGTVDYMAPEQAQGLPLTASADLYATGVMLYEMLTGTLPFQGKNSRETMLQHINGRVVPPSARMPERGISAAMDAVVMQSLAKDPARRFGSARAMKQAVGQALSQNGRAATQATAMIPQAPRVAQAPPVQYQLEISPADAGAGLNGAFKGLLMLLLIGVLGIGFWGAYQLATSDRFDFDLPAFLEREATPTPTATSEPGAIQPSVPAPTQPPAPAPTSPPAEQVQPTTPPLEPGETVPIEPIEPDGEQPPVEETPEAPNIEPSGYDDGYRFV